MMATCVTALLLTLLASCEHKELCYDHSHITPLEVEFNWQEAPDANPSTMSLYLYPEDGSEPLRYEFTSREGGTIKVPIGTYDVICLNSDKETHRIYNKEKRETFEVTTGNVPALRGQLTTLSASAPLARGSEAERQVLEPEALWTAHAERLTINPEGGINKIVLMPKPRVTFCSVEVLNVQNLNHAVALSASVTGMAGGWLAGIDRLTDERVTIPFEVNANSDKTMLTAMLSFFGHCPSHEGNHKVMIYAKMTDGSTYYMEEDVTDQIHDKKQDPEHIKIVLDKLPLPKPIEGGGGLQPSVKDWEEIKIDLPM